MQGAWNDEDEIARAAGHACTYAQAARHAQRDVRWCHRMIAAGRLRTLQRGGRTFVDTASLGQLLARDGAGFSTMAADPADQLRSEITSAVLSLAGVNA
jgi:hypothetical protein